MRSRIRNLAPASGPAYELFDSGVFLAILGLVGYVLTEPTAVTDRALYAPFAALGAAFTNPQCVWGLGLTAVGVVGVCAAYGSDRWVRRGYTLVTAACVFASGSFLAGIVFFGASPRAILSAVLYGWIASRLMRSRRLYPFREVPW